MTLVTAGDRVADLRGSRRGRRRRAILGPMTEPASPPVAYPAQWEADVVLRDGSVAHVRPIRPEDADGVRRFHAGQSAESIYLRFFAPLKQLSDRDVARFTEVDYHERVALVATVRDEIIGIARYDRIDATTAEVAFNISDAYQGRGVGSVLLEHLAAIAQEEGVRRFVADVLPQNRKMISVFTEAGYEVATTTTTASSPCRSTSRPTEQSQAVAMAREHRAESVSMRAVLCTRDGRGGRRQPAGGLDRAPAPAEHPRRRLHRGGLRGQPRGARGPGPAGLRPGRRHRRTPVDLAVIAVPADVGAGGRARVRRRRGPGAAGRLGRVRRGRARGGACASASCCAPARSSGMRVIGPNSFGLINTHPDVRLNASLAPALPPAGRFGLFAQSGALGIAVLASAARRNLGVSVVRLAPATGSTSPATTSCSTGSTTTTPPPSASTWSRWATRASSPGSPGSLAPTQAGHRRQVRGVRRTACRRATGVAPTRVPPGAFDAMLRQAGVIRVENVHQLFDVAQLVVHQPLPQGSRVGDRRQLRRAGRADRRGVRQLGPRGHRTAGVAVRRGVGRRVRRRPLQAAFADERRSTAS